MVDKSTVIGFGFVGCIGCTLVAAYYFYVAITNQTGPKRGKEHMKDYSGRFEMDLLPVFVNGITAMTYLGECIEEIDGRFGFFNRYRYCTYVLTCPLMIFELVATIGAPYSLTMSALTFMSLICAVFADVATSNHERWVWFTMGTLMFVALAFMLRRTQTYARKLNDELCGKCETMNQDLKSLGTENDVLPTHMLRIETPMDKARLFIEGAMLLMWTIWPIFPVAFVLEKSGVINRDASQVIYACADLVCKTLHSIFLDFYKEGLRQTVFSYGFLDSNILHEIDVWEERGVYHQLKVLSRATYGDQLMSNNSDTDSDSPRNPGTPGLDFHTLLVANQRNQTVNDNSSGKNTKKDVVSPSNIINPRRRNSFRVKEKDVDQSLMRAHDSDEDNDSRSVVYTQT